MLAPIVPEMHRIPQETCAGQQGCAIDGSFAMSDNGKGNGKSDPAAVRPRESPWEIEPPQREAAYFYGLFMRGHSLEELRRDIDVSSEVQTRWQRLWRHEPHSTRSVEAMLSYRRQVLAIFNTLVSLEVALSHLRQ
ncbi:MAG: hypothetical protein ACE5IP_06870 [Terriglobia bacterium]